MIGKTIFALALTATNALPVETTTTCLTTTCTPDTLLTFAGAYRCGDRISWLKNYAGYTEWDACHTVAVDEFPAECGTCAPPIQDGYPTRCGTQTCTVDVLSNMAGGYSCGDRISWLRVWAGHTEENACKKVAVDEFPTECGACYEDPAAAPAAIVSTEGLVLHLDAPSCAEPVDSTAYASGCPSTIVSLTNAHSPPLATSTDGRDHWKFNGANNYLPLQLSLAAGQKTTALTVEAWFRTTHTESYQFGNWAFLDFDRSEHFNFYLSGPGKISFSCYIDGHNGLLDTHETSAVSLADGEWHHAAVVFDNGVLTMYRDGVVSAMVTSFPSGFANLGGGHARYGFIGDGSEAPSFNGARNNLYYNGDLGRVRYYHRALSPSELGLTFN